jgi:hypothetical protein
MTKTWRDVEMVQQRRKKLPKSVLDDQFFSLAEMNAFLDVQGQSGGGKAKD